MKYDSIINIIVKYQIGTVRTQMYSKSLYATLKSSTNFLRNHLLISRMKY